MRNRATIPVATPYNLARTLTSGQCFRWTVTGHRARGIVDGTVAVVRQAPDGLTVEWDGPRGSLEALRRRLGADEPLAEIETTLSLDPVLRRLLPQTSGIAMMRQDPWECLVCFVVSAFNNIPKISLSIQRLARCFGRQVANGSRPNDARGPADDYRFPSAARLADASLSRLRACALGYRAPYVRALARLVADGQVDLHAIARLTHADARAALLALPGVGEKVADCVLLFAYGRGEAFPVDVWVQRAVERWYFRGRTVTPRVIRAWAQHRFGNLAGYAQQHLFAGARLQKMRWRT